jgi:hypothetical protein
MDAFEKGFLNELQRIEKEKAEAWGVAIYTLIGLAFVAYYIWVR